MKRESSSDKSFKNNGSFTELVISSICELALAAGSALAKTGSESVAASARSKRAFIDASFEVVGLSPSRLRRLRTVGRVEECSFEW